MKKRQAIILATLVVSLLILSCGDDDASEPAENVCDRVTVSNNQPAVRMDCNSISGSVSGITYDQFGRVIAFNFDWKCTTSLEQ